MSALLLAMLLVVLLLLLSFGGVVVGSVVGGVDVAVDGGVPAIGNGPGCAGLAPWKTACAP